MLLLGNTKSARYRWLLKNKPISNFGKAVLKKSKFETSGYKKLTFAAENNVTLPISETKIIKVASKIQNVYFETSYAIQPGVEGDCFLSIDEGTNIHARISMKYNDNKEEIFNINGGQCFSYHYYYCFFLLLFNYI